jgi:hypothetical protein
MLGYQNTIISQYANSPVLLQIIQNYNTYFDPQANLNNFYSDIWDVATAQGYGLDVWGRIVGVSRVLQVAAENYLGFNGVTTSPTTPFNVGPLYAGGAINSNFALTDSQFRTLIYAKALANIWDGSTPGLNKILLTLLPENPGYVVVASPLNIVLTFPSALTNVQAAIIGTSGVLPVPAGVGVTVTS